MTRRSSSRSTRSRSTRRTPQAQATSAFNRLVAERPVVAAIVLVVVAVLAFLYLRYTADSGGTSASSSASTTAQKTSTQQTSKPSSTAAESGAASGGSAAGIDQASGLPYIAESDLPPKGQQVLAAIHAGGPFEFDEDGDVFGNFERILPKKKSGYYHEYTVKLPGDSTRGAHRLVTGDDGTVYWTADHYASFSVVKEGS